MIPNSISPEVSYAMKNNIMFPGTATEATAARAKVKTDIEGRTNDSAVYNKLMFTVTVAATSIVAGV